MKIAELLTEANKNIEDEKAPTAVSFGATAIAYNSPHFGEFGAILSTPQALKQLNEELQAQFPEATVVELQISDEPEDDEEIGGPGEVSWSAELEFDGPVTEDKVQEVGEEVAGMLFGQYGLGDLGELEWFHIDS